MLLCYSYQTPNLILSSSLFFSLLLLAHLFSKLSSSIFISSLLLYLVTPSSSVVCICCFKFCSFTTPVYTVQYTVKPFLENARIFRSCQQMKRGGRVVLIHMRPWPFMAHTLWYKRFDLHLRGLWSFSGPQIGNRVFSGCVDQITYQCKIVKNQSINCPGQMLFFKIGGGGGGVLV